MGVSKSPKKSIGLAIENAQKAISLDGSMADAHALLGWLYTMARQHEKGIAAAERGLELNPNSADAYLWMGYTLNFAGMCEEAIKVLGKSIRLSPLPRIDILFGLCIAYRDCGRYEEAISAAKVSTHREPNSIYSHTCLASCYALLDRNDEAQAEVDEILRIYPKYTLEIMGKSAPYKNPVDRNRLIGALRKAGLK